jgi:hypothetical protein
MNIIERLRFNAARKSDLDRDKASLNEAADMIADMFAALTELADIVQGLLDDPNLHGLGIDSFTLQPARAAIARAKGEA